MRKGEEASGTEQLRGHWLDGVETKLRLRWGLSPQKGNGAKERAGTDTGTTDSGASLSGFRSKGHHMVVYHGTNRFSCLSFSLSWTAVIHVDPCDQCANDMDR